MIQRIQTVYLVLGAAALMVLMLIGSFWSGPAAESQAWFVPAAWSTAGLAALTAVVAVFLYRDREKQRRVIVFAQVLTVIHLFVLYGGLYLAQALYFRTATGVDVQALITLLLPILAYVLFLLARRGVVKDIELVRSMDRLR